MPIQPTEFHRRIVTGPELPPPCTEEKPAQQTQTDDHVKGMKTSHGEVEGEKDLRLISYLPGKLWRDFLVPALSFLLDLRVLLGFVQDFLGNIALLASRPASSIEALADNVARNMAFFVFVVVFLGLDQQEHRAKDHGQDQKINLPFADAFLRGPYRHSHGKAAA